MEIKHLLINVLAATFVNKFSKRYGTKIMNIQNYLKNKPTYLYNFLNQQMFTEEKLRN